mgnify:CR=1 FL=1
MNEVNSLLGVMVQAAEKILSELGSCRFLLPVADSIDPDLIRKRLGDNPLGIQLLEGQSYDVMNSCDMLIIASGSATLEAGILGCPMVLAKQNQNYLNLPAEIIELTGFAEGTKSTITSTTRRIMRSTIIDNC